MVKPEHEFKKRGVRVCMPLPLLQAAFLILALQGQLNFTCEMQKVKLTCNARKAGT